MQGGCWVGGTPRVCVGRCACDVCACVWWRGCVCLRLGHVHALCVCACGVWEYTYVHVCAGVYACVHVWGLWVCVCAHVCECVAGDSLCSQGVFTGTSLRHLHEENGTTYGCLKKKATQSDVCSSIPRDPVAGYLPSLQAPGR